MIKAFYKGNINGLWAWPELTQGDLQLTIDHHFSGDNFTKPRRTRGGLLQAKNQQHRQLRVGPPLPRRTTRGSPQGRNFFRLRGSDSRFAPTLILDYNY
jgi:hypothetical protein